MINSGGLYMLDIALVDDNIKYTKYIKEFIQNMDIKESYDIDMYDSANAYLNANKHYDILLLDIEMPEMDGITLAKKLYQESTLIIYITNYNRMEEAFFINVFKYIMKSKVEVELEKTIKDAIQFIDDNTFIEAKTEFGYKKFKSSDLKYVTYKNRKVYLYANGKEYQTNYTTLEEIEKHLSSSFIKINRNTIINGYHIEQFMNNEVKMFGIKESFEVSRRNKEKVLKMIFQKVNKI